MNAPRLRSGRSACLRCRSSRRSPSFPGWRAPVRDEGKFLDRRDDNGRSVRQRTGKLLGVIVDLLDYPGFVLELVDRVLQLLVEHEPVGDDNDRMKHLLVIGVV